MRRLGIDLETFSSVDIRTTGAYAYVNSSDFEILLFGYAFDDDPVQVVSLVEGEELPAHVVQALFSPDILKTAYNANFEMTCLKKYFNKPMVLNQWACTSVLALTLGLPGYLDGVTKALGFPEEKQKMLEGKRLITYFCKPCNPSKINGGRTRNLPEHDAEKWTRFKEYNAQDVVVEREVLKKCEKYRPNATEYALWQFDQKMNNAGVLLDIPFIENAIKLDGIAKEKATEELKGLTGLENPASVLQFKTWLENNLDTKLESIDKAHTAELLKNDLPAEVKKAIKLKQLISKTSVKKYTAMLNSVCDDGRIHGVLQFYGANRTGRWCLTGDHEVLTDKGWVRLDEWQGGPIACWSAQTELISFQTAKNLSFPYSGKMYKIECQRCEQISTPDHKMPYMNKDGFWAVDTVENVAGKRFIMPFYGRRVVDSAKDNVELRVLLMTQADGHYTDEALRYHFRKARKIERCKSLLRKAGIAHCIQNNGDGTVVITIKGRDLPLWLRTFKDKTFGTWLLDESADIVFDELAFWDGYHCGPNSIQYTTTNKQNADIIQALACLSGRSATIIVKSRKDEHPNWNDAYVVNIWLNPGKGTAIRREYVSTLDYVGNVYCAETKTGFFVVRRNGKVWITGNSGRVVQLQNLPQNHLEDLDEARQLVRVGDHDMVEMLYGNVPNVLSQLIRTALVASQGSRFIVADFSAIEARVIAWLADENWRQEVFAAGGDIYCASASQMFKVPVEKHGVNSHLRQKGKVAELALGYGGSSGALIAMGALNQGVLEEELPELVRAWRAASPNIVKFWNEVDELSKKAVINKTTCTYKHGLAFCYERGMLFIRLPSGRRIAYVRPRMGTNRFGSESITYEGMNQETKKWVRLETYGAKLVENIVQATARDCLASAMLRLDAANYKILFHVHDEVIIEAPYGFGSVDDAIRIMSVNEPWNKGLILTADGYETEYYRKD